MAFRVKDLMISVLNKPEGLQECARGTLDPRIIALTPRFCNMGTFVCRVTCPDYSIKKRPSHQSDSRVGVGFAV
jgi:hypothetical protein